MEAVRIQLLTVLGLYTVSTMTLRTDLFKRTADKVKSFTKNKQTNKQTNKQKNRGEGERDQHRIRIVSGSLFYHVYNCTTSVL